MSGGPIPGEVDWDAKWRDSQYNDVSTLRRDPRRNATTTVHLAGNYGNTEQDTGRARQAAPVTTDIEAARPAPRPLIGTVTRDHYVQLPGQSNKTHSTRNNMSDCG
ncbi:hypothetical protein HaLaN_26756 [Haematococcus lacustris]|uniref:Uncharacterized protein n=1 Tax=Haematococcus lacustris TaxID=44745 RepID=A0A6A0A6V9_HAELA|nr:hypothetical protein HaLaN_26756 [Haematococcus lacustris]